ncbi:hypothetical protein OS125_06460 [Corynebacterium sp. P7003]|uniref:Uncharacterized protein n=1 Tax=Corynebacterium pygosceleis TaxID=2800406 RepID=A0ABT3WRK9_9CORY|nr:hypothetical protein [Corynebacterium pygosceleis]MCX7444887.1 hypothetical protein [Corynebacterium pygosceleis]
MKENNDSVRDFTISIYQHPDHVAGLVQQIYRRPLIKSETASHSQQNDNHSKLQGEATGEVGVSLPTPILPWLKSGIKGGIGGESSENSSTTGGSTFHFEYSQATYLYFLRDALIEKKLLKQIKNITDAKQLKPGDFVEFEAKFTGDQVTAILDILTPEIIEKIVEKIRTENFTKAANWGTEEIERELSIFKFTLKTDLKLARSIANAVRNDFRSNETREYYGHIGTEDDQVTAITICDNNYFLVQDRDRILDGKFKVLGKVTEGIEANRPVLERNKILDKIEPRLVDKIINSANEILSSQVSDIEEIVSRDAYEEKGKSNTERIQPIKSIGIQSRVHGESFKVVPISIYI